MQSNVFAALLAVLLVGAVGAVPVAALSDGSGGLSYGGNDTAPGEQFAGSVSVGEAEVENDVDERAFEHRLNQAANDSQRASIVAAELNETEARLAELREQRAALKTAFENGEISEREYRVRTAKLAAELSGVEQIANRSASAAAGIPNETLAANGVDAERIDKLRSNASELRGGEVAEIARNVAGPNAGGSPGERPNQAGNRSEAGRSDAGGESDRGGTEAGEQAGTESGSQADDAGGVSDGETTATENGSATSGTESSPSDSGDAGSGTDTGGSSDGSDGTTTETESGGSSGADTTTETEQSR
ncbi:DUF7096 domain-containing protein [Haloparvum sp. PAK95]|uniref:DUF7096 domain-containing protein n=1 Tax=Haloparvum sp. PAK95 TaxID=3418962 RepID=UPI003D2F2EC1